MPVRIFGMRTLFAVAALLSLLALAGVAAESELGAAQDGSDSEAAFWPFTSSSKDAAKMNTAVAAEADGAANERVTIAPCKAGDSACAPDGSNAEGDQCCPAGTFMSLKYANTNGKSTRSFTCERGWDALKACTGQVRDSCPGNFNIDKEGRLIFAGRTETITSPLCPPRSYARLTHFAVAAVDGKQKLSVSSSLFGDFGGRGKSTSCFTTATTAHSSAGAGKRITVSVRCLDEKKNCNVKYGYAFKCIERSLQTGEKEVKAISSVQTVQSGAPAKVKISSKKHKKVKKASLLEVEHDADTAIGRIQKLKAKAALQP